VTLCFVFFSTQAISGEPKARPTISQTQLLSIINAPSSSPYLLLDVRSDNEYKDGHIDSAVSFPPAFGPHVKADRARVLVMDQKMDAFPGVPTFSDYGIKGSFGGWSGVFAPKGVPQEVVEKLAAVTAKVMKDPKVQASYENIGALIDFRHGDSWIKDLKATYNIYKEEAARVANK